MSGHLKGVGASPGLVVGPARRYVRDIAEPPASDEPIGKPAEEAARAVEALEAVAADLDERAARAGGEAAEVLGAQAMMARDPDLADAVAASTKQGRGAPRAVWEAFAGYREMLAGAGEYLAARLTDLDDLRDRAVARLVGTPVPGLPSSDSPYVLLAHDLAPADTALLDPALVLALVTEQGGPTSHTAILARSLGVPAVVACAKAMDVPDGTIVLVDGSSGVVQVDPPAEQVEKARVTGARSREDRPTGPGATADGHQVPLLANIGGPAEVAAAVAAGAEGVGLFRTEFLFLDRSVAPTVAEQVAAYQPVLAAFPDGKVVVRVLDAGADKPLGFLPAPEPEPNPALGIRGLRMLNRFPHLLAEQLRALALAADGGGAALEVMAPMVTDAAEAADFAARCRAAGIATAGVMIEVPAAALRAADIAAEVDFVSIGTNDLTQYALAADRMLAGLATLQDPWHPAILDLIAATAEGVTAAGGRIGVCGEAAADPALACVLVGLGVQTLSMGAGSLQQVRAALAACTVDSCGTAAQAARSATTAAGARTAARTALPELRLVR